MSTLRLSLTNRDREILDALTLRVRLLSVRQVGRHWWSDSAHAEANAKDRLKILQQAGLVEFFTGMMRPELPLLEPVFAWEPGEALPDFARASYHLTTRWTEALRSTICVIATKRAGEMFGGKGGRFPKAQEETHDLHCARMFLNYRDRHPELMPFWQSEEIIKRDRPKVHGEKLPDAMIVAPNLTRVVEFGGEYFKDKLIAFHGYCAAKGWPYEIW